VNRQKVSKFRVVQQKSHPRRRARQTGSMLLSATTYSSGKPCIFHGYAKKLTPAATRSRNDTVTDFENGADKFDLRGVAGVDDRSDLHMTDTGTDVLVVYGSGSFLVAEGRLRQRRAARRRPYASSRQRNADCSCRE